jgi:hypothetical protein
MAGITPKWVAEHGAEIGVDGSRIAFVNSVGGDMAGALFAARPQNLKAAAIDPEDIDFVPYLSSIGIVHVAALRIM